MPVITGMPARVRIPPSPTTSPTAPSPATPSSSATDAVELRPRACNIVPTGPIHAARRGGAGTMSLVQLRLQPSVSIDRSGDLRRLSDVQQTALTQARAHAKTTSAQDHVHAVTKTKSLGFTPAQLEAVLDHVRAGCELTINFNPDKSLQIDAPAPGMQTSVSDFSVEVDRSLTVIDALCKDPNYRNQYETGISSGMGVHSANVGRDQWEKRMFGGDYHQGPFVAHERPRYGAMNIGLTAAGAAATYGSCYLVTRPGVRERTTFTAGDSCQVHSRDDVGTADAFAHIIARMPDQLVKDLFASALDGTRSPATWSYVEAQIHGPIEFSTDISAVVIAEKFFDTPYHQQLTDFAKLYGIDVRWHLDNNTVVEDAVLIAHRRATHASIGS